MEAKIVTGLLILADLAHLLKNIWYFEMNDSGFQNAGLNIVLVIAIANSHFIDTLHVSKRFEQSRR